MKHTSSKAAFIRKLYGEIGRDSKDIVIFPEDHARVMEFLVKWVDSDKQITLFKMDLERETFQDVKQKLHELL